MYDLGQKNPKFEKIVVFVFFVAAFLFFTEPIRIITDFWWHISTGRWIFENHSIPSTDPFLFTSSTNESSRIESILKGYWLSQLSYYLAFKVTGWYGLVILKSAIFFAIYLTLFKTFKLKGLDTYLSLCVTGIVILFSVDYNELRPQTFSFLCFLVIFYCLEKGFMDFKAGQNIRNTAIVYLPIIMAIWANLHPGFILGCIALFIYLLNEVVNSLVREKRLVSESGRKLYAFLVFSMLAALANPNHLKVFSVISSHENLGAGKFAESITEHFTPWKYYYGIDQALMLYLLVALGGLTLLVIFVSRKDLELKHIILFSGLFAAAAYSFRYVIFFTLVGTSIAAHYLAMRVKTDNKTVKTISLILISASVIYFSIDFKSHNPFIQGPIRVFQAEGATNFIKTAQLPNNIFNPYEWGGFLIWSLHPEYKLFIDARTLEPQIYDDYRVATEGKKSRVFKKYGIKTVIFYLMAPTANQMPSVMYSLLKDDSWALVYDDPYSLVFTSEPNSRSQPKDKKTYIERLIKKFKLLSDMTPLDVDPYLILGQLYYIKDMRTEALSYFQKAYSLSPNNLFVLRWLNYLQPDAHRSHPEAPEAD